MWYLPLIEKNLIPDFLLKKIIKFLNYKKLQSLRANPVQENDHHQKQILDLRKSSLAVETKKVNEQHYEVPYEFFTYALGPHLKYSSAYWENQPLSAEGLRQAEEKMLKLYLERGEFQAGQKVLELGCGWGSLTLFLAKHFPKIKLTALTNSKVQKEFIEKKARSLGIKNIKIIKEDINRFKLKGSFDRIISIEMFEHLRNYENLFKKLNTWLKDQGKLFVHVFCHRKYAYPFEVKDNFDWISKYFFSGGMMPSKDLFLYFASPLKLEKMWLINGNHYAKTGLAWLANVDRNQEGILKLFEKHYKNDAVKNFHFWRLFFLAVHGLFSYDNGNEWMVAHYLFKK